MSSSLKNDDLKNRQKPGAKAGAGKGKKRPAEQIRRVSSITRKLHWYGIRRRMLTFLWADLLFVLLAFIGWCADREYAKLGSLILDRERSLQILEKSGRLVYRVCSPDGRLLIQAGVLPPLMVICTAGAVLFLLQLTGQFLFYFREDKKIRRILSPINEIALKADALSRLSFSEDKFRTDTEEKYHAIEQALEHISPERFAEETPLSFNDSDLSGVEAAMNNLLLRMRDTYRQQARFVNDASHELRTPIAVILGYANMLDRWGKTDPKTLDEGITAIKNEADQMNHLVEQLLFLARGDSGKTSLEKSSVNVCDLMQEVYEESFMIDEGHHYRIRLPENHEILTEADPGLLKQAVRILIDNAAKYTPPGDEIILSAGRTAAGEPFLQVQDTGVGIAESEIPQIFDRFYRSDEVRSSAGTGLGLAIAKWIVDKHEGHFEILSRQELGTRIRIVLPA
ncbi:MAG: sensor histidine kinase [Lachnospiraceae bacterium]|nr:sensor histidine kinase [Lachnospiraceae bacterium]